MEGGFVSDNIFKPLTDALLELAKTKGICIEEIRIDWYCIRKIGSRPLYIASKMTAKSTTEEGNI